MIANELRIGNLVYKCYPDGKETSEVISVSKSFVNGFGISAIEPIPLTESLISEICFNENKVMGMYRLQLTDDYTIAFSLDNDMIYIGDDIEIRISKTPLHRLQNLYLALSGKELPLEL